MLNNRHNKNVFKFKKKKPSRSILLDKERARRILLARSTMFEMALQPKSFYCSATFSSFCFEFKTQFVKEHIEERLPTILMRIGRRSGLQQQRPIDTKQSILFSLPAPDTMLCMSGRVLILFQIEYCFTRRYIEAMHTDAQTPQSVRKDE